MYKLYLIVFVNVILASSDEGSSESKYIDLLPDEEKKEFLETIARRILAETSSTETPKASKKEISDDQLNEHTSYVEKVVKEESDNLRSDKNHESDRENKGDDNDRTKMEDSDEDIKVKSLEKERISVDSNERKDDHIDLTLRQRHRERRDSVAENDDGTESVDTTHEGYTVTVRTVYEGDQKNPETTEKAMEGTKHKDKEDLHLEPEETTKMNESNKKSTAIFDETTTAVNQDDKNDDKIQKDKGETEKNRESTEPVDTFKETTTVIEENSTAKVTDSLNTTQNVRRNLDDNIPNNETKEQSWTKIDEFEPEAIGPSVESGENETYSTVTEETTYSTTNDLNDTSTEETSTSGNVGFTQKIYEEVDTKYSVENDTSHENETESTSSIDTTTVTISTVTIEATTTKERVLTTTEAIKDTTTSKNRPSLRVGSDESVLSTEKAEELSENNKPVAMATEITPITVHQIKEDITEVPSEKILTSSRVINEKSAVKNEGIKLKESIFETDKKLNESKEAGTKILSDLFKALRQGIDMDNNEEEDENVIESETKTERSNLMEYVVNEIPANEVPFVKKKSVTTKEQPYYVPIYNYDPENAYYNPANRYGPNNDDDYQNNDIIEEKMSQEKNPIGVDYYFDDTGLRSRYKKDDRKFRFGQRGKPRRPQKQRQHYRIVSGFPIIAKPRPQVYINPDDYLDVDYYFGKLRAGDCGVETNCFEITTKAPIVVTPKKFFPDSNEEDHPSNSMNTKDIKNHLTAVRQILFENKFFSYVPTIEENEKFFADETTTESPTFRSRDDKKNKHKDISMDYYFGRTHPKDNNKNRNNVFKYKKNKDVNYYDRYAVRPAVRYWAFENKTDNENDTQYNTMKDILNLTDVVHFVKKMDDMQKMNLTVARTATNNELTPYIRVISDMIYVDDFGFKQYDWLSTTVDIQAALKKLSDLTEVVQNEENVHPSDYQLLKYVAFLHKLTQLNTKDKYKKINTRRDLEDLLMDRKILLPRNKNRHRNRNMLKAKGLINRVWLYIRGRNWRRKGKDGRRSGEGKRKILVEFQQFLDDMHSSLYDLHSAIKYISFITEYNKQRWYYNIKELYLTPANKKKLLEVILHLSTVRLLGLIEDSSKNGAEENFVDYVKKNRADVKRTAEEFTFILSVLEELKRVRGLK